MHSVFFEPRLVGQRSDVQHVVLAQACGLDLLLPDGRHRAPQVEQLRGLVSRLPAHWADATALPSITEWLAGALEAQVLLSEPRCGVLAASPDIAVNRLAHLVSLLTTDAHGLWR
ncbi:hypothetical protein [Streptomyces sp. NBC_00467]|uniref:hypothetical protein n=1 Tax=Streptomyces sp. NBC_00467 TaxID=2975752 RepID=UPI002E19B445